MIKDELSPTMQDAINFANEHGGTLTRYPGGFWCKSGLNGWTRPWFGTTTIEALVKRGRMEYTEWFEGSRAKFPVAAKVTQ